ncbi:aldo/keto reductase [Streptomyces sp. PSKA54]|uniref:Aldo/keto reductase n=1 Tax=Streptomyces himalayensis subsp. aureolus TaxID=2758039 RepID=A0A7W2HGY9_9ACTN|nr:aldo/keto reductase [Streptomyces himalayensis]MBA4863492.1 aldo/keto reductase [Streptomyces himalayensis subsp. aureolus]
MRLRVLGRSGLRVSELCLGTMTFGTEWGFGAEEETCREIYDAFREAGGNFVDTADVYTEGASETITGRLIAAERDAIVLGTKYTLPTDKNDPNSGGSHRKSLRRSVETSLRRLGTDYVDLLWVHAWDQCTPVEETLRALDDLVRAGKVLAVGVSNTPAWVIARSDAIAELRGWNSFCALQLEYSLAARTPDRELLPMARTLGLAISAWSPLARGLLAREPAAGDAERLSPSLARALNIAKEIAAEIGTTPAQVALAWVLQHGLMPVIGARTVTQIRANLTAVSVRLDASQLERLDAATRVRDGYPHDFLQRHSAALAPPA